MAAASGSVGSRPESSSRQIAAIARRVAPLAQPVAEPADRLAQVTVQQTDRVLRVGNPPVQFVEDVIFESALPLAFSVRGKLAGFRQLDGFEHSQAGRHGSLPSSSAGNSP